jgi:Spy/CpxP family protein refolding chaperone
MTQSQRIAALLALAIVLAGAAIAAAEPGSGRGPRAEAGWSHLTERLGLTEEQKQAIGAIREGGRARQLETRKQVVQLESQLHTVMLADTPDEAAALELVKKIGDLRSEMQASRVKMRLAIRKQLTPEQRTQFILMEGRGGRGRGGQPGFPGPGPDGERPGRGMPQHQCERD